MSPVMNARVEKFVTSTHVGYQSVIRAVASGVSLKFGVQGASATNWLLRVNGARDNGIRLYSPETPNLGQIRRFLEACDLEIWQMTLQNNRAPLLCYFKLSTSFRSHWWIQTWVTVRKRPIWVKFDDFWSRATLKFDGWPCKTIGHLFYATSSFVHHFVAIGEFKLELQSGNAQSGSNLTIFGAVRRWNLTDDLAKQ